MRCVVGGALVGLHGGVRIAVATEGGGLGEAKGTILTIWQQYYDRENPSAINPDLGDPLHLGERVSG